MLSPNAYVPRHQRGFTLLEVLITIIVLAFGLLGLASLQGTMHLSEMESYQRAQAVVLLNDMISRLQANRGQAANYVTAANAPLGADTANDPADCTTNAFDRDRCEWAALLRGAGETRTSGGVTTNVGAMIGARGCIEQIQAANNATGVCAPGIYRVTVAWQGLHATSTPALTCAAGLYGGNDAVRRAVSSVISLGLPRCT